MKSNLDKKENVNRNFLDEKNHEFHFYSGYQIVSVVNYLMKPSSEERLFFIDKISEIIADESNKKFFLKCVSIDQKDSSGGWEWKVPGFTRGVPPIHLILKQFSNFRSLPRATFLFVQMHIFDEVRNDKSKNNFLNKIAAQFKQEIPLHITEHKKMLYCSTKLYEKLKKKHKDYDLKLYLSLLNVVITDEEGVIENIESFNKFLSKQNIDRVEQGKLDQEISSENIEDFKAEINNIINLITAYTDTITKSSSKFILPIVEPSKYIDSVTPVLTIIDQLELIKKINFNKSKNELLKIEKVDHVDEEFGNLTPKSKYILSNFLDEEVLSKIERGGDSKGLNYNVKWIESSLSNLNNLVNNLNRFVNEISSDNYKDFEYSFDDNSKDFTIFKNIQEKEIVSSKSHGSTLEKIEPVKNISLLSNSNQLIKEILGPLKNIYALLQPVINFITILNNVEIDSIMIINLFNDLDELVNENNISNIKKKFIKEIDGISTNLNKENNSGILFTICQISLKSKLLTKDDFQIIENIFYKSLSIDNIKNGISILTSLDSKIVQWRESIDNNKTNFVLLDNDWNGIEKFFSKNNLRGLHYKFDHIRNDINIPLGDFVDELDYKQLRKQTDKIRKYKREQSDFIIKKIIPNVKSLLDKRLSDKGYSSKYKDEIIKKNILNNYKSTEELLSILDSLLCEEKEISRKKEDNPIHEPLINEPIEKNLDNIEIQINIIKDIKNIDIQCLLIFKCIDKHLTVPGLDLILSILSKIEKLDTVGYVLIKFFELTDALISHKYGKFDKVKSKWLCLLARTIYLTKSKVLNEIFNNHLNESYGTNENFKKVLHLIGSGVSFEINNNQPNKSSYNNITDNELFAYFHKDNSGSYTHTKINKNELFGVKSDLIHFVNYLEDVLLKHISSESINKLELISLKSKVNEFKDIEKIWDKVSPKSKFKHLAPRVQKSIMQLISNILSLMKSNIKMLESYLAKMNKENIFVLEKFSSESSEAIQFIVDSKFYQDTIFINEKYELNDLITFIMETEYFYKTEINLINLLYFNDIDDFNMIIDKIELNCDELDYSNELINSDILNRVASKVIQNIELSKKEKIRALEIKAQLQKISSELSDNFLLWYNQHRYGLCTKTFQNYEKIQEKEVLLEELVEEDEINSIQNQGVDLLHKIYDLESHLPQSALITYRALLEKEFLLAKTNKSIRKIVKDGFDFINEMMDLGDFTKSDIDDLEESFKNQVLVVNENISIDDENVSKSLSMIDLYRLINSDIDNIYGINKSEIKSNFHEFIRLYRSFNYKMLPVGFMNFRDVQKAELLLKEFANIIGCYHDYEIIKGEEKISNKKSAILLKNATNTIPYLVTKSRFLPYPGKRAVIVTLINKPDGKITEENFRTLSAELMNLLDIHGKYGNEKYWLICLVKGNDEIYHGGIDKFDHLLRLQSSDIAQILACSENTPTMHALFKYLVKGSSITKVNPYSVDIALMPPSSVLAKRQPIETILNSNNGSFVVYGARRIGKTTLCNEIKYYEEEKGSHVIKYSSPYAPKDLGWHEQCLDFIGILNDLQDAISITPENSFTDLQRSYEKYLNKIKKEGKSLVVIIDEFDLYLKVFERLYNERELEKRGSIRLYLPELIKTIASDSDPGNCKVILSGFMSLFWATEGESSFGMYSFSDTPKEHNYWRGHFRLLPLVVLNKEAAKALIEILEIELALEFRNPSLKEQIINLSSRHPAYIQKFCHRLIESISYKINEDYRLITSEDINAVINETDGQSYYKWMDSRIQSNFNDLSYALLVALMYIETNEPVTQKELLIVLSNLLDRDIDDRYYEDCIKELVENEILISDGGQLSFKYPFWKSLFLRNMNNSPATETIILDNAKSIIDRNYNYIEDGV